MTIITTQSRITYAGDGVSTVFPIPFEFFLNSDITAVKNAIGGGSSTLIQTVDYVLSGAGTPGGGFATKTTALLTGETLAFFLNPPIEQESHYPANNPFPASTLENDLDRQTQISQRLNDILSRSLHAPDGDPMLSTVGFLLPPAAQRAGTALGFDVNGNPVPVQSIPAGTLSAAAIGAFIGPQTAAEASAGVAVVFPWIPSGNVLRYGVLPNNIGAATNNGTILQTLFNAAISSGPTGQFYFPNTTGADNYFVTFGSGGCITVRDGCKIDLQGSTLNLTGTGVAADSSSGFFFAIRDFEMKNGTINVIWATGVASSAGNAVQIGARAADSVRWPVSIYDSLLTNPTGNSRLANLRINMNVSGANLTSSAAIALTGGLHGIILENLYINGNATLTQGISYEFGWATNETQPSARQSSHMHNFVFRNIEIVSMDTAAGVGMVFGAAYQGIIENYSFSGVSVGASSTAGESMFYRPWAGVDDIAGKRSLAFRNITGLGFSNAGLLLDGHTARAAGSGYLQRAWVASTAYGIRETVVNGGNMYVATTGGTAASSGGPTGTGTGIADGTVVWNYVPLTANVDQIDYVAENCDFATTNVNGTGIISHAGYLAVRNSTFSGGGNGIFLFAECTRFDIEAVRSFGGQLTGIDLSSASGLVWATQRLKSGTIRNCYVYGNSVATPGNNAGININNCIGVLVENCKLNLDVLYNGVAETTQGNGVQIGANAFGVICRNNHVGNVVGGGNAGYASTAGTGVMNANDVVNPSGTITFFGPWNIDGTGDATTTNLGLKTSNINTVGKYFKRRCFNSSNNRLLIAAGSSNTDIWSYCDGNAPGSITPS